MAGEGKVLKFVPASGAASRMFKNLFEFLDGASDTPDNDFIKKFFSQIHNFAFFDELDAACQKGPPMTKTSRLETVFCFF